MLFAAQARLATGAAPRMLELDSGRGVARRAFSWRVMKAVAVNADEAAPSAAPELAEEAQWMRAIARGDAAAYRALSTRYLTRIVRYAARVLGDASEAEDVAQETFLRLWKHAERWQPKAKPSTWLYRVAHNLCVDRLRARRPGDAEALERQSVGDRPSQLLARKQLAAEVEAALQSLPERQRAAIVLSHYEGLSNPEAAAVLGVGVEAVESLLSRGRRALKQRLQSVQRSSEGEGT